MRKSDDQDSTFFRSTDRVFCQNGKWFFETRESDHGPYPTRAAAEMELQRYVDEMRFFDDVQGGTERDPAAHQDGDFADFTLVEKD